MLSGAARGHLRIEEGGITRKEVDLDAVELRKTSIIYDPAGSEISLHLELFGADGGRSAAERFVYSPNCHPFLRNKPPSAHRQPTGTVGAQRRLKELGHPISPLLKTLLLH